MKQKIFLFSTLFIFFLSSCATIQNKILMVKYPNQVESSWRADFNEAEKSFDKKDYKKASKLYQSYLQKYPYNELSDLSEFRLGQISMLDQNYSLASSQFLSLIKKTPSPEIKAKSNVKLGICQYRQKNYSSAEQAFDSADVKSLQDKEIVKMASFWVNSSEAQQESLNDRAYPLALLVENYNAHTEPEIVSLYGQDNVSKVKAKRDFKEWVVQPTPIEKIDKRLMNFKGKVVGPYLDYKIGKAYFEAKDSQQAQKYLSKYVDKNPNHDFVAEANKMLSSAEQKTQPGIKIEVQVGNPKLQKVGVLLPLSGKFQQYGNNMLKGMQCAASVNPACHGVNNVQLIIKDSAGDPKKAAEMLEELSSQSDVNTVLGPLVSAEVENVAKKADEKQMNILTLSQKKNAHLLGSRVFQLSLNPSMQVKSLFEYASYQQKIKRLAVFYPNNNYGQEFLSEAKIQAPNYGIKIVSQVMFNPAKDDLSEELRTLKTSSSQVKGKGDFFDAIFIPDSYLSLGKILPKLSTFGMDQVKIMGTNAWNDPSLPSKMGQVKNAFFVDLFSRNTSDAQVQTFVKEFQAAYDYLPSTLEAMGYDAVKLVAELLKNKSNAKADDMKSALENDQKFDGVTGLKGFLYSHEALIKAVLVGVDSSGFKEIK